MKTFLTVVLMIAWAYFFPDQFIHFWGNFIVALVEIVSGIAEVYKTSRG